MSDKKETTPKQFSEQDIYKNILVFMDRVTVKGINETAAFGQCINFLTDKQKEAK